MISKILSINISETSSRYKIEIGRDLLQNCGEWVKNCLNGSAQKVVLVSNAKIFRLYGEKTANSLIKTGFEVFIYLIKDGERYKNFRVLEKLLAFFSENKLTRTDAAIALGGGVVGDLTGFAAAIFLRGIPFLQIPTTLLAMIDSSVGGKTAVNSAFGKNLIGAFYQPEGVLVDSTVLQTLERRELTAGFCEAVKQGAISSEKLFNQTADFLREFSLDNSKEYFTNLKFKEKIENLIAAQIAFKAEIVANDERENIAREDAKSRKILNFGHTVGHALEKITDYKYFKHGEAVGLGIICAAEISKNVGILNQNTLTLLNDVVGLTGKLPATNKIEIEKLREAFEFDKKQSGKNLQWVLLEKIGSPIIVDGNTIPAEILQKSLRNVLNK
ncbi:MAG TPA: 3-dehydroquinate synthase [Pyrinomonadaceae bacterium]|nr:3-dehydroquinate synthase [Pyrinomonadaceae bacterium]